MTRRLLAVFFGTALAFALAAQAADTKKADRPEGPKVDPKATADDAALQQDELRRRFDDFKAALIRVAQRLENTGKAEDRDKAKQLRAAIEKASTQNIDAKFLTLIAVLKEKDTINNLQKLGEAAKTNAELRADLALLIEMLIKDNRDEELKKERERIARLLEQLKEVIGKQERVRAQTELGRLDKIPLGKEQKNVTQATAKLANPKDGENKHAKSEAKYSTNKSGQNGEAKPETKDNKGDARPEGKPGGEGTKNDKPASENKPGGDKGDKNGPAGENKDNKGDKTDKPGEGKGSDSKPSEGKPSSGGDKENKPSDGKGDGKKGDGKPSDGKGDGKKGDGKGSESKSGEGNKPGEGKGSESKGGEGKPGDGKGGDSKGGEGKPGDGKGGESKDGKPSDGKGGDGAGKPGDGKSGEPKDGNGKGGDSKPGSSSGNNGKPGEGKEGTGLTKPASGKTPEGSKDPGKPSAGKPAGTPKEGNGPASGKQNNKPNANPSEAKGGAGKAGAPAPTDTKGTGDNKGASKGDGKGSAGKPSSGGGKPSQGGSKSGGQGKGDPSQGGGQPGDQKPDDNPIKKQVEDSNKYQKNAEDEISKGKNKDASDQQDKALEELKKAQKTLEELLKQIREEETERLLAKLQERCEYMLRMQKQVYAATKGVHNDLKGRKIESLPEEERGAIYKNTRNQRDTEDLIIKEANEAIRLIMAEGTAIAFAEVFRGVRSDMQSVSTRLGQPDVGEVTQTIEADIIAALQDMIDALKKAREENKDKGKPGKPGQKGPPADPKLLDTITELKLILSRQIRVNDRTQLYAKQYKGEQAVKPENMPTEPKEKSRLENIQNELQGLSDQQKRIGKVTNDLYKGKNKAAGE